MSFIRKYCLACQLKILRCALDVDNSLNGSMTIIKKYSWIITIQAHHQHQHPTQNGLPRKPTANTNKKKNQCSLMQNRRNGNRRMNGEISHIINKNHNRDKQTNNNTRIFFPCLFFVGSIDMLILRIFRFALMHDGERWLRLKPQLGAIYVYVTAFRLCEHLRDSANSLYPPRKIHRKMHVWKLWEFGCGASIIIIIIMEPFGEARAHTNYVVIRWQINIQIHRQ